MSYIKREEAINAACSVLHDSITAADVRLALKEAPAVNAVEVVRCEDCAHGQRNNFPGHLKGRYICEYHQDFAPLFSPTHFCSFGERMVDVD